MAFMTIASLALGLRLASCAKVQWPSPQFSLAALEPPT